MDKKNITQDPLNALQNFASRGNFNSEPIAAPNTNQMVSGSVSSVSSDFNQRAEPQIRNVQEMRTNTNVGIGHNFGLRASVVPGNRHMNVTNNQGNQTVCTPNKIYNIESGSGQMYQLESEGIASGAANQMQINPNTQCNSLDMPQIPVNSTSQNQMNTFLQISPLNSNVNVVHKRRGNQQSIGNMGNSQANKKEQLSVGVRVQAPQNLGSSDMSICQGYNSFSGTRGVSHQSSMSQTINQSLQQPPQHAQLSTTNPQMIKAPASLSSMRQVATSSAFNPKEDQLYREKYQQLTKYIEPLKRIVSKIGNDGVNADKITKMSKLLEILVNPNRRVPLETLLKCEKALEKMDILNYTSQTFAKSSNSLYEAVKSTIQNPLGNYTMNRTFKPALDALFGTDIVSPIAKHPRIALDETSSIFGHEIPHVLQGEIARLDQKFKVSLDSSAPNYTNTITLKCCLDDIRLPCVPPICISIPEDYPSLSPMCSLPDQEYSATPFLLAVQNALTARIVKLPKCHSLSHLLDTWEMAVRQACSPKVAFACDITDIFFG